MAFANLLQTGGRKGGEGMTSPFGINYAKDAIVTKIRNRPQKPLVFISGPYSVYKSRLHNFKETGKHAETANTNIAMGFATLVMRQGGIPFIPHLTHFWHLQHPRDWEEWLVYDSYWLAHCDCLVRIEGESRGADAECTLAQEMGLRIITEEEVINGFDFTRIFA